MAKDRVRLPKYISGGDMSANITGPWINISGLDNVGFQAVWSGGTGTFGVDISEDGPLTDSQTDKPSGVLGPTALTLPNTVTNPAGSAGSTYIDLTQVTAPWIRLNYAKTSGTGTLNVGASAKAI